MAEDRVRFYMAAAILAEVAAPTEEARFFITSEDMDDARALTFKQAFAFITWAARHESLFEGLKLQEMLTAFHLSIKYQNFHSYIDWEGGVATGWLAKLKAISASRVPGTPVPLIVEGDAAPVRDSCAYPNCESQGCQQEPATCPRYMTPLNAPPNTPKRIALAKLLDFLNGMDLRNMGSHTVARDVRAQISKLQNEEGIGFDAIMPVLTERESELRRRTSLLILRRFVCEHVMPRLVYVDVRATLAEIVEKIDRVIGDSVWTPAKEKEARASDVRIALASVLDWIRNARGTIPKGAYTQGELKAINHFLDLVVSKIESVENYGVDLRADWQFRFEQLANFIERESALAKDNMESDSLALRVVTTLGRAKTVIQSLKGSTDAVR